MNIVTRTQHLLRCGFLCFVPWALLAGNVSGAAAPTPQLPAKPPQLEAAYWREPIFLIPYRFAPNQPLGDQVEKIRLLVAEQSTGAWTFLEEGEPHLEGFKYHAPRDGQYWFAVQLVDRRGHAWPSGTVAPQLRVVVDTQPPSLKILGFSDGAGHATLRYDVADAHLDPDSLTIEVNAGDDWTVAPLPEPDVRRPDRLVGRVVWTPPAGASQVRWRAAIADRAKNRTTDHATTELPGEPAARNLQLPPARSPAAAAPEGPALEWPADRSVHLPAGPRSTAQAPSVALPPEVNPYTRRPTAGMSPRVPAQFAADHATGGQTTVDPFASDLHAAATPPTETPAAPGAAPAPTTPSGDWAAVDRQTPHPAADRVVNSATFEVEYDLQSVGRYGVARVALWGTRDGGATWRSFAVDDDNRSPIRVSTPGGGVYGFRLVIDGANGATAATPQPGDPPELTVQVDLIKPTAKLVAAELGPDHLSDHLLIRWSAADANLQPRPIGLFYSTYPDGPWSTAATDLENTGQFAWRIERHVPERFYLRLEVRDQAGNVTSETTPTPIVLNRPQPTGRLKSVRPVAGKPRPVETPFSPPPAVEPNRDQTARVPGAQPREVDR